ncbi:MAG: hypothetical protein H6585_02525 [Flavobacteriales bacterium]|nr:hypothetical protein [Flavobacteriales bacterium]MCB9447204.1 hypothetical protein [Flavobacteriales bacterium]
MKIVSWNLKNIGQTKLGNNFTATIANKGLGNNVGDYINRVVMGNVAWTNILTANPADIFIVIELKTGGHQKGKPVSGTCIPTITTITANMNNYVNGTALAANYTYNYVTPQVVGYHEAVGIIFNTQRLTFAGNGVLRDNNNLYINPRTPYGATFTINGTANQINVVGIHAPPPSGGANIRFKPPIDFARKVATVPQLATPNSMVSGDYNCDPTSTYTNGFGNQVGWNFAGYGTLLAPNTLSSVRNKVANGNPPPANYLSDAYDNLLFNFAAPMGTTQLVADVIANARDMTQNPPTALYPGNLVALVNNYNKVSDHLPVVIEF